MTLTSNDILMLWERVTNKLVFLEKHYVFRQGDMVLHPSELHVLLAIRQTPDANATRLAERLGVTKGAVSQLLKRLEVKGVITKQVDPSQKNEVTMSFTCRGKQAIDAFVAERESVKSPFEQYLDALGDSERATLRTFLRHVEKCLPGER
jgi:DNA-binding MarR family transcriptional regulator